MYTKTVSVKPSSKELKTYPGGQASLAGNLRDTAYSNAGPMFQGDIPYQEIPRTPGRILGISPGSGNFMTCAANFPSEPFIIDGAWIKSANQWFNKYRARLLSELTRGYGPEEAPKSSKRLDSISRERDNQIRDFFYKAARYIVDYCVGNRVEAIVFAHNTLLTQDPCVGAGPDPQFMPIPYANFWRILTNTAKKAGIPVSAVEGSYTSRASLIDGDALPVYGRGGRTPDFSGVQITRGQYKAKDGTILNAGVNKAGNIIRKAYPDAFGKVEDFGYLNKTVRRIKREQFCGGGHHAGNALQAPDAGTLPDPENGSEKGTEK